MAVCNLASIAVNMFVKTETRKIDGRTGSESPREEAYTYFDFKKLKEVTKVGGCLNTLSFHFCVQFCLSLEILFLR